MYIYIHIYIYITSYYIIPYVSHISFTHHTSPVGENTPQFGLNTVPNSDYRDPENKWASFRLKHVGFTIDLKASRALGTPGPGMGFGRSPILQFGLQELGKKHGHHFALNIMDLQLI